MREISRIILHHTATSQQTSVESIRRYHTKVRGWRDIGYHYLIDANNNVRLGRPEHIMGAHVRGHNGDSIGVALIGNFQINDIIAAQTDVLHQLFEDLLYRHPNAAVIPHRVLGATLCPGDFLYEWWKLWVKQ